MFGSLDRMLAASDHQLIAACGEDRDIGRLVIAARRLIEAGASEAVTRSEVDSSDPALAHYLTTKFRRCPYEEMHAIFVDESNGFITEEVISVGGQHSVSVNLGHIVRRLVELGASGMILFHNHPSKQPNPSVEDIRSTQRVRQSINAIGVRLIDHLVVAGRSVSSMKRMQLL